MQKPFIKILLCSILVCLGNGTLFLDACLLTGKPAQVVKLGATHLTYLVHFDAFNVGRLEGEDTLHTYGARHFTNSETLFVSVSRDFDNNTAILLNAFLVTFDDFVCYGNGVTGLEVGVRFSCSKCFFSNFN